MSYNIEDVDYNISNINKIPAEILKLFNNSTESANPNNEISLLDCIQEYSFKSIFSEEQICDVLSDDELFKNILLDTCNSIKYKIHMEDTEVEPQEQIKDITDSSLWDM
jgi:hypothetical protein